MRQKVALTAAHLLCEGDVADMGMGSGKGSHALASLYPDLRVVGVDVNPAMVQRAFESYGQDNLRFIVGDIARRCFDDGTLEAIINSSVLHHVTSFNGYQTQAAVDALRVQSRQLADEGILVVRDFLRPADPEGAVHLELADESTAQLLVRFSHEFRRLSESPGFELQELPPAADGWRRFRLSRQHAVEFVLRKDYRTDWELEVAEEYTYLTQAGFERVLADLGLRVLASAPVFNPWIIRNRFQGKFRWSDDSGSLDWPATNYVVVGQRVADGLGVRFSVEPSNAAPRYLELSHWRRDDGLIYDLARRPGMTADIIPWFVSVETGAIHVLARRSYPRPVMATATETTLDGARAPHYVTEPLVIVVGDKPLAQTAEERLAEFPSLQPERLVRFDPRGPYYPSPGGLQEQVRPLFVRIEPTQVQHSLAPAAPWSTWGALRAMEARQLLRAAQVGGLPDARLELNVYDLLLAQGQDLGPWIGESVVLASDSIQAKPTSMKALLTRPRRRRFRRHHGRVGGDAGFLAVQRAWFSERAADGSEVGRAELESVRPLPLSSQTVVTAPITRDRDGQVLIGLDDDDLPAAQCFTGHSDLLVAPAWRLPHDVVRWHQLLDFARRQLRSEYGLATVKLGTLGGRYHPSPGCTAEVVYPLIAEVIAHADGGGQRPLYWVPLHEVVRHRDDIRDGHLRVAALRAFHACGLDQD